MRLKLNVSSISSKWSVRKNFSMSVSNFSYRMLWEISKRRNYVNIYKRHWVLHWPKDKSNMDIGHKHNIQIQVYNWLPNWWEMYLNAPV